MTEGEMALQFIEENGLAYKFIMWQELILEPQVVDKNVQIDATDTEVLDINWDDTND